MTTDLLSESPPQWLSVSAVSSGPSLVVSVAGEADWVTSDQLRDQLMQTLAYGPRSVVLDLADLKFCNLRGLGALHEFCDVARQASVDVTVRGISRQLTWLIDTLRSVLAGELRDHSWARRPILRAVPETSTGVGGSWDSRAAG